MDKSQEIARIPLFERLDRGQLAQVASIALEKSFAKGQTVFIEGENAAGFHVVRSGRVKIYKISADGKEQILHVFGPGEPIGEVPVFEGGNFPAFAEAIENAATFFFPRNAFISVIEKHPEITLKMMAVLCHRLRRFTKLVDDLSLKEVPARVADYLLALSSRSGGGDRVALDMTKTQLAALLGTVPETLSRILARMGRQGVLRVDGKAIELLDRPALEGLAAGIDELER